MHARAVDEPKPSIARLALRVKLLPLDRRGRLTGNVVDHA
jgi:hypothetical protein